MKIILIDDHPLVLKGLVSVLSLESDIEIIGEASTVEDALSIIKERHPDIALLDIRLGNENGLELIEKILSEDIQCKFIILTSMMNKACFERAKKLGAMGYVSKEALPEELIYAMKLVIKGRKYYDPAILDRFINTSNQTKWSELLTNREQEVLFELGKGKCNKDIAHNLFISIDTVKKHVSQILSKLELADRTKVALYAQSIVYSERESDMK